MRLLLVEDNEELALLMAAQLAERGFLVDRLAGAEAARKAVRTGSYSAVLLDRGLPDGDGLEVLKDMRSRLDATPVLVLTARGGMQSRAEALRAGADDYFIKPVAIEVLVDRIGLTQRSPASAAAGSRSKALLVDGARP